MTSAAMAALRTRQRDVREERMTAERRRSRHDAVVTTDAKVVALGDVVGEHDPAALTEPAQRGQEHPPLEVLGLVDHDEAVGEAAPPDVGEREHLEQVARDTPPR